MSIPRAGTPGRIVGETIYTHGPLTFEQGVQIHKLFGQYLSRTRDVYRRALQSGWLVEQNGVYSLSPELKAYLDAQPTPKKREVLAPTPPREHPPFRPLSLQRIPSLAPRRENAEPARDIYYIPGTARPEPLLRAGDAE